jgi:UDP-glucose 4-epimerase
LEEIIMSNILVTGGFGFIGSNLVETLLKSGSNVTVLDSLHTGNIENLKGLTADKIYDQCINVQAYNLFPDAIYHLGIASSSPMYKKDPMLVGEEINNTIAIFELAKKAGCKVVYASSSSLYNGVKPPHKENAKILVKDYYTEARLAIERTAELYHELYGVESVGLRFFSVYGPKETYKKQYANMVTQFLWEMKAGKVPTIYGDGSQTRDFTYVTDIVNALILAMNSDYQGILNAGTGKSSSFNAVINILNEALLLDIQPTYLKNPIKNYVQDTLADTAKVEKELGFETQVSLKEGIKNIVKYYQ